MNYITISTSDLKRLLELSAQFPFAVIDGADNTDGEGVWHCDVEYYDEQGDETPTEVFSFNKTRDDYLCQRDKEFEHYVKIRNFFIGEDIKNIADERGLKLEDNELGMLVEQYIDEHDMTIPERVMIENLVDRYKDIKEN